MKRGLKKCLSIILTIVMLVSVMSVSFVASAVTINGNDYKSGDIINYYLEIEAEKLVVNGQYEITYNNNALALIENKSNITWPVVNDGLDDRIDNVTHNVVDNKNGTSTIYFNFTILEGVDFSNGGRLFDFYFEVKDTAAPITLDYDCEDANVLINEPGEKPAWAPVYTDNKLDKSKFVSVDEVVEAKEDIDLTELKALITKGDEIMADGGEGKYTGDTYSDMVIMLDDAKEFVEKLKETPYSQPLADKFAVALKETLDGLRADKTALEAAIEKAKTVVTKGYTEETVNAFTTALEAAIEVNNNEKSTPDEVANAVKAIEDAIAGLVVDKTDLVSKISFAEELSTVGYTAESVEALNTAIAKAKEVNENEESTPEEVAAAIEAINGAVSGLTVDKTELAAEIEKAKAISTEGYTAASAEALAEAIAQAESVYEDADSTCDAVASAVELLRNAEDGLVVDTAELEKAIADGEAELLNDEYSEESKAVLQNAIDAGKALIESMATADVTPAEVSKAAEDIKAAISALARDVLIGDANKNGVVNIDDATYIQKYLVRLVSEEDFDLLAADVNEDGKITIMDATQIQINLASNM